VRVEPKNRRQKNRRRECIEEGRGDRYLPASPAGRRLFLEEAAKLALQVVIHVLQVFVLVLAQIARGGVRTDLQRVYLPLTLSITAVTVIAVITVPGAVTPVTHVVVFVTLLSTLVVVALALPG